MENITYITTTEVLQHIDNMNLESSFQSMLFNAKNCTYDGIVSTIRSEFYRKILPSPINQDDLKSVSFIDVKWAIVKSYIGDKYRNYLILLHYNLIDMLQDEKIL